MELALAVLLFAAFSRRNGGREESEAPPKDEQLAPSPEEATPDAAPPLPWGSIVGTGLGTTGTIVGAVLSAAGGTAGTAGAATAATAVTTGAGATATGGTTAGAATGGATGGATATATASTAAAAGELSLGASLGIFAIWVVVVVAFTLVLQFTGPVLREFERRRRYGAQGLSAWVRFTADQFATTGTLRVLDAVLGELDENNQRPIGRVVMGEQPTYDLPPEEPTTVSNTYDSRLAFFGGAQTIAKPGRPERMAYDGWIQSIEGVSDRNLLRDVYRGLQLLGLQMAETDNLIRWFNYRFSFPNESEAAAQARLAEEGIALSPAFFQTTVQDYWARRQYTPWGDAAPVDPLTGNDNARRALDYVFGARRAEVEASFRLWGAANAWKWLQTNADLLSRKIPYENSFTAAGLRVKSRAPDDTIVWYFPAAPKFLMSNGVVVDLSLGGAI